MGALTGRAAHWIGLALAAGVALGAAGWAGSAADAAVTPRAHDSGARFAVQRVPASESSGSASGSASATSTAAFRACSSSPFRARPAQHVWFRVPSVVRTPAGTLVAFAERRDRIDSDLGDFDVVTARSTNGGCSWSRYRVIGNAGPNRVSNPTPVVDRSNGRVLVFSVITGGQRKGLYLQTSRDDGKTFSSLLGRPIRPAGRYKGGLTGPGHGIQLAVSHPGRLVVPLGYKTSAGLYGAYGIYSDDHGANWRTGYDQQDRTGRFRLMEGTLAELPSGRLFISYRLRDRTRPGTARQYALSGDGGASLSRGFKRLPLSIVSVAGSALAPPGSNLLLFSAPAVPDPNLRRQLSIFISRDAGASWARKYPVELAETPGAYSDLVQLGPAAVGVIYETGVVSAKERIAFESVAVTSLLAPVRVASSTRYQRSSKPVPAGSAARVKALIRVAGSAHPPGRVRVSWSGSGSGSVAVRLRYSNKGVRLITLPKLAAGSYHLRVSYSGNERIKPSAVSAGTLTVT